MRRLFVALPLPPSVRQRLMLVRGGVPGARWVPEANYHLTLRFIGDVDDGQADDLAEALDQIRAPAFALTLDGVGRFGSGERSRVLWAGVPRSPELTHLQAKVESALVRAGLPPEGQKFTPHVTLAYLRNSPAPAVAKYLSDFAPLLVPAIPITEFVLYSSWPGDEGSHYHAEVVYPLLPADRM